MNNLTDLLFKKTYFLLLITTKIFFCSVSTGNCQQGQITTQSCFAEKIYLQLDGKVYTTDQTIWFKAIVATAFDHKPSKMSGVLYVDLIAPNEHIIDHQLIKIQDGIGSGFFQLSNSYSPGSYMLRAYTQWNENFDHDFMFKEYIEVFPSINSNTENPPISSISLNEKTPNKFWLNAILRPQLVDSLHQKKLKVYVTLDGKKDSLFLKENKDQLYQLDYALDEDVKFATIQFQTENFVDYTKTIALDENYLDLQFFPEGGELVNDIISKVAFKALDYKGKGETVKGSIINDLGDTVTYFNSNELGMGAFIFRANSDRNYFAVLDSSTHLKHRKTHPLPTVVVNGYSLMINPSKEKIKVVASSNLSKNDSIYMNINCRGRAYYHIAGKLTEGNIHYSLDANSLPEGVLSFSLIDHHNQPVAQRLYFNERKDDRLNLTLTTDKNTYSQREKTQVTVKILDGEEPKRANLSFLVIDENQTGEIQNQRQNILSYLLIDSDLKGEIENPGHYFNQTNKERLLDLDALLLTQGWSRYNYSKSIDSVFIHPEYALNVSGSLSATLSKKKKKEGIGLTMMTFGQLPSAQTQTTDSLGRFYFNTNDQYGKNLNILIQSTNKSGEPKTFSIELDKKNNPEIHFNQTEAISSVDSVVYALAESHQKHKQVEDAFRLSTGVTYLDEVLVEDYKMTPEREKVMKAYGKPNIVIDGKKIQEKEEKWSYGLYSVLLFQFPKEVSIRRIGGPGGYLYASINKGLKPTLVVIDGIPVGYEGYSLIQDIPPSEVKSFELINSAHGFFKLYMDVFPWAHPLEAPKFGSVIAIYTYAGKGLYGVEKPKGLLKVSIPVFSAPREFYAPKHENLSPQDWIKPDLRSLIHWTPEIWTDDNGKAEITYYNSDKTTPVMVVVEAITEDGKIGYETISYPVRKKR